MSFTPTTALCLVNNPPPSVFRLMVRFLSWSFGYVFYKPTLVNGRERTELHIQWRREPGDAFSFSGKPPADGMYVVVADAMPAGKGKTTMTVYAPTMVFTVIPKAIKHWANGTNLGCPDLTKGQNSP